MTIYTKKGDKGLTELGTGSAILKSDVKVEAYGTVDELSSFIGLALSILSEEQLTADLLWVQRKLFVVSSILAFPGQTDSQGLGVVTQDDVVVIEAAIDVFSQILSLLHDFILPGGSTDAALLHLARAVCRRAERLVCSLDQEEYPLGEYILPFLNRLSDYLFCAARYVNHQRGINEDLAKSPSPGLEK